MSVHLRRGADPCKKKQPISLILQLFLTSKNNYYGFTRFLYSTAMERLVIRRFNRIITFPEQAQKQLCDQISVIRNAIAHTTPSACKYVHGFTLVYQYIRPMVPPGFPGQCHLPGQVSHRVPVDFSHCFSYPFFLIFVLGFGSQLWITCG